MCGGDVEGINCKYGRGVVDGFARFRVYGRVVMIVCGVVCVVCGVSWEGDV